MNQTEFETLADRFTEGGRCDALALAPVQWLSDRPPSGRERTARPESAEGSPGSAHLNLSASVAPERESRRTERRGTRNSRQQFGSVTQSRLPVQSPSAGLSASPGGSSTMWSGSTETTRAPMSGGPVQTRNRTGSSWCWPFQGTAASPRAGRRNRRKPMRHAPHRCNARCPAGGRFPGPVTSRTPQDQIRIPTASATGVFGRKHSQKCVRNCNRRRRPGYAALVLDAWSYRVAHQPRDCTLSHHKSLATELTPHLANPVHPAVLLSHAPRCAREATRHDGRVPATACGPTSRARERGGLPCHPRGQVPSLVVPAVPAVLRILPRPLRSTGIRPVRGARSRGFPDRVRVVPLEGAHRRWCGRHRDNVLFPPDAATSNTHRPPRGRPH